ncbi:hypothetical protein RCL1_001797 [Eukaryota sp. TZLM3-RCL]
MSKQKDTRLYPDVTEIEAAGIGSAPVGDSLAMRTPVQSQQRGHGVVNPTYTGRKTTLSPPLRLPKKGARLQSRPPSFTNVRMRDESTETVPTVECVEPIAEVVCPPTRRDAHKAISPYLNAEGLRFVAEWAARAPNISDATSKTLVEFSDYMQNWLNLSQGMPISEDMQLSLERSFIPLRTQCPIGVMTCSKRRSLRKRETTYERDFAKPFGIDFFVLYLLEDVCDVVDHVPGFLAMQIKAAGDVLSRFKSTYPTLY